MHEALIEHSPFAQEKAVVGRVQNNGVIQLTRLGEMIDHPAHVLVDRHQAAQ